MADKKRDQTTMYNNWNIRTALQKAAHLKIGCSILYFPYFSRLKSKHSYKLYLDKYW